MTTLDDVTNMKAQGMNEQQIIKNLKDQGVTPADITNALSQSQVKAAVAGQQSQNQYPQNQLQPSVMNQQPYTMQGVPELPENPPAPQQDNYQNQPQDYEPQYQQDYYPQDYSQGYDYGNAGYDYAAPQVTDTDTIIEVSEQVFQEKSKDMEKQLNSLNEFKTISDTQIKNMSERLKKLESTIDRLQAAIIEKVGSYGNTLQGIRKEMSMIEDSFGKVMKGQSASVKPKKKTAKRKTNSKRKK